MIGGSVSGPRINHDDWSLRRITLCSARRHNPHQTVIYRPFQSTAVEHEFGLEMEDVRCLLRVMFVVDIASLSQRVEKKDETLSRIQPVFSNHIEIRPRVHLSILRRFSPLFCRVRDDVRSQLVIHYRHDFCV